MQYKKSSVRPSVIGTTRSAIRVRCYGIFPDKAVYGYGGCARGFPSLQYVFVPLRAALPSILAIARVQKIIKMDVFNREEAKLRVA